jgi:catalase
VQITEQEQFAEQVIDSLNEISGRHSGYRAAHAKGTLCAATFTASPAASALTRAAHMQGGPVRAHARFSNGGGNPGVPDRAKEARGIATKFYLPDGSTTDVVAVTLPVFLVRTPEDFLEFMRARRPDPETGELDMERIGAFLGAHPETVPAVQHTLSADPPASYLRCSYNALHTFRFVNADGDQTHVRYRWEPEDGEATISPDDAAARDPDYLQRDLAQRLEQGAAAFTLSVQVAEQGDPLDDPTAAWPEERERVVLGRLELTGLAFDREQGDDVLVFDPTRVTDGIECSEDPILLFRSPAYAESVLRRSGVRREPVPS